MVDEFPTVNLQGIDMLNWEIKQPFETKLNKLKKTNIEAFYYWYRIYELFLSDYSERII
jgi:predicted methyltransferase